MRDVGSVMRGLLDRAERDSMNPRLSRIRGQISVVLALPPSVPAQSKRWINTLKTFRCLTSPLIRSVRS